MTPQSPVFKEQHIFEEDDSNRTNTKSAQYYVYLRWDAPSNSAESDLDLYLLYVNDTLVQNIQANQRYAVVNLQKDVTTTVKIAAADKCRQVSNYTSINLTNTNSVKFSIDNSTELLHSYSTSKYSITSLILVICAAFLTLTVL